MKRIFVKTLVVAGMATVMTSVFHPVLANGIVVNVKKAMVCNTPAQVQEILDSSQPLKNVISGINERQNQRVCRMLSKPVKLNVVPVRRVMLKSGKAWIVKLTDRNGKTGYTWKLSTKGRKHTIPGINI